MADGVLTLDIPCGQGSGLNSMDAVSNYPITDLKSCDCVTFEDGTAKKEGGATKINTTVMSGDPVPSIIGLWDFWPVINIQKRIAGLSDGRIVSFGSGGIIDTLATGLNGLDVPYTFCEAVGGSSIRKLFAFTGADTPLVTSDGSNMDAMSKPAADWSGTNQPIAGVMHNNRLWCFGNPNYPHRLYYSTLSDHEDFQTTGGTDPSGSFNIYQGEGSRIIGACDFANILYIFKYPRGIYWINDSSTTMSEWTVQRLTRGIGMSGVLAGAQIDNDYVFFTPDGMLASLVAVQQYGLAASVQTASILPTNLMKYMKNNLQTSRVGRAVACYYPFKREWHLAFAQSGFNYNNRRLVLDLKDVSAPMLRIGSRDVAEAFTLMIDANGVSKPVVGDNAGFARFIDQSQNNVDVTPYTGRFETGDVSIINDRSQRANLVALEVFYKPVGNSTLYVDVYRDGIFSETKSFFMGTTGGGQLDSFVLGADVLAGGGGSASTKGRITGDCRRIKLIAYNSDLNGEFSVSMFRVHYTPGNDRV